MNNYRRFVQADGSPSSALILEPFGTSTYVTPEARERLQEEFGVKVFSPTALSPVELSRSAPTLAESPITSETLVSSPGDNDVSMMPLAEGDQALDSPANNDAVEDSPYKHLDFSIEEDSVSSLGSLGDLTKDDITVATTTLFNFLRQETENIKKMFEESERAERAALEGSAAGGGGANDNASIHTRQSAMSKESEEIRRASQQAETMAKQMAQATSWIGGTDGDEEEDDDDDEDIDSSPGRLYSIHQTGDMLEFGIGT